MISRLPKWAWWGAAILAFLAGVINAVGFLGFAHQGLTHLTGSTTLLGAALARGEWREMGRLAAIIGSFVAGCMISGAVVQDSALKLGRRYGVALALESALLFAATPLLERGYGLGLCLASCASGLQNGMVSTFSGAVLRTTHVSGAFTDLGIFLGQKLGGVAIDSRRLRVCALVISGFILGATAGAVAFAHWEYRTLYGPAVAIGIVGGTYAVLRERQAETATRETG